ncbi:MAG TPA: YncE family protein [Pseudoneobacillus sp.]|nr:YncE family protein [Pseudoneobacillus sp.]
MKKNMFYFFFVMMLGAFILSGCGKTDTSSDKKSTENSTTGACPTDSKTAKGEIQSFFYTANEGGSISKIDAQTYDVIETIKVEGIVHNVQVSPNGKLVGATVVPEMNHEGGHSMEMHGKAVFYDTVTNDLIHEVEVGNHPAHIVFTENGKYSLVTNNEDNNVSVIDLNNYTITQTISTGKGPHGFRISKDSKFAYIANMGEDTVSVLNLESFSEEKKIKVGSTPVTTALTSDGKTLFVTLNSENAVAIVDLISGEISKIKVGIGPAQVYIQADNQFAFIANQGTEDAPSNSVTKIDLRKKEVVATINTGKGSHGVVTSPDNQYVYVTNMVDNTVSVIDNEQNKVIETIEVDRVPNGISVMPE